ncbi:2-phospho-L-lactate guanylyltransferase [Halorubrum vacuolatum]|uniref:2-phospho-L-lactate guanylyltransferase n=1 Tax=Halorubrum vacuolatum TaxID=63740 RepID=A0A238UR82_HALVU|nr:2-phospho-L-lactate guanylyltransferase [Halorubrum vacuolatum]SNR24650.1 phospholactate guanylyltransferase [Halorubrum vacuolatum]
MEVLVPFSTDRPKSRLSSVLSRAERTAFARAMCTDVLAAVRAAGGEPTLLTTPPAESPADDLDVDAITAAAGIATPPVIVDDRALSAAVNAQLVDRRPTPDEPVAVVMADLAIATSAAIERLLTADGDVVIAPGRGGGTNALVVRDPSFRVDYHGASVRDHRRIAAAIDADVREIDSHRLASDVDEPADLTEVLLHGDGAAAAWLREAGFRLGVTDGRVGVVRE